MRNALLFVSRINISVKYKSRLHVIIVLISFREKVYSSKSANLSSGANMQSYRRKKIQCEDFMDYM